MSLSRKTWRRRLALAHRLAEELLVGRRVFFMVRGKEVTLCQLPSRLGQYVYDGCGQISYLLIG